MRKILTSILFSSLAVNTLMADPITPERAMEIAKSFAKDATLMIVHKGEYSSQTAMRKAKAKGGGENVSPFYIISKGEGKGFVIVSGDDCVPEVMGVVESGDYDENDMPESFRDWIMGRAKMIEYAQENGINSTAPRKAVPAGRVDIEPLIKTHWHQTAPYNDKCPKLANGNRAVTGCVATALSQIIYYWHKDANHKTKTTTPTYDYGAAPVTSEFRIKAGTPVRFELMRPSYSGESAIFKEPIATLMATVGMTMGLEYGESTGGQISDAYKALDGQFGLNSGTCEYKSYESESIISDEKWSEMLYEQMEKGWPVLYCGYNAQDGGHAVVCDGYQASTGFFHINFGWGYGYDGYFTLDDWKQGWGFNQG